MEYQSYINDHFTDSSFFPSQYIGTHSDFSSIIEDYSITSNANEEILSPDISTIVESKMVLEDDPESEQQSTLQSSKVRKTPVSRNSTISKRTHPWTTEEDSLLKEIVKKEGSKNWDKIALNFPLRDRNQCRSRYHQYIKISKKKTHSFWTTSEDSCLLKLANKNGSNDWKSISCAVGTKTHQQCANRFSYLKPNLNDIKQRKRWVIEEDLELINLVRQYGSLDWKSISEKMSTKRNSTQCSNRYNGYLKIKLPHSDNQKTQTSTTTITTNNSSNQLLNQTSSFIHINNYNPQEILEPNFITSEEHVTENERIGLLGLIQSKINLYNNLSSSNMFFDIENHLPNNISISYAPSLNNL